MSSSIQPDILFKAMNCFYFSLYVIYCVCGCLLTRYIR